MSVFQKIRDAWGFDTPPQSLPVGQVNAVKVEEVKKRRQPLAYRAKKYFGRTDMQLSHLEFAIHQAEREDKPSQQGLAQLYKRMLRTDAQVITATKTRRNKVLSNAFVIFKNEGKVGSRFDKKKKALLDKTWFRDFIRFAVDADFFGHSLIELGELNSKGEIEKVSLVPRESVIPKLKQVVVVEGAREVEVDYSSEMYSPWLVEVENCEEALGWFVAALRFSIMKNFSLSDWVRRSEKYGMPIMAVESDITNDEELDEIERAMSNLGSDGFVILPDGTRVSLLEPDNGGSYSIYDQLAEKMDKYISKLFLGQTMTMDDGSSYSQGKVHAETLDDYTRADLMFIKTVINDQLLPKLVALGYDLEGYSFDWYVLTDEYKQESEKKKNKEEDSNSDESENESQGKEDNKLGKSLSAIAEATEVNPITSDVNVVAGNKSDNKSQILDLDEIVSTTIQAIFDDKINKGDLSPALINYNYKSYLSAISDGYGKAESDLSADDRDIVQQLRTNARVFATFKNHANVNEMVAALVDENGNRRSFEQFKKAVLPITDKYNVNWLRTEFDTATASARMAADWQVFQSEKKLYPFLRYETVGDGRVRPEHAALDGMTVSVDSPLLDIYATPNGYKCRCYWIQVASGPERVPKVLPEVPENFRNNPGKSGKLWATMGEYDNDVSRSKRNALEAFADVFVQNKSFQDIRTRVLQYLRKHVLNAKYTYSEGSFTVPSISVLKRLLFRSISILLPDGTNRPATDTKIQALLFLPEIVSRATKIETEEVEGVKLTRIFSNFGANLIVLHLKSKVVGGLMVLHDITLHHPKVGYK